MYLTSLRLRNVGPFDDASFSFVDDEGKAAVLIGSELIHVDFTSPAGAIFNPNNAYGTVDDAIVYIEQLIEAGADEILFMTQMGTVPHDVQMHTIRELGEKVLPHFRGTRANIRIA